MKLLGNILKALGIIIGVLAIAGFGAWRYASKTLLTFEKGYEEKTEMAERVEDGFTYLDRNDNEKLDVYEDSRQSTEDRVADLLSQMTLEEKIHLLKGSGIESALGWGNSAVAGAVGTIVPTPRLGIPTIYLSDGPAGLRIEPNREGEDRTYYCTAFPIGTLLSSTWDTDLVTAVGRAMGTEAKEYGIDVILGPGANVHRHPFCGRSFEYYSEDPVLTGRVGAAMVNGIESQNVGASVKHYVANNQETNRNFNDTRVSDRAMREIYLKGFEIIVQKSQPWTIMSSYNRVNGTYTSESRALLTDILRDDLHFQGLVMSDWFAGSDAVAMVAAGNDLIEPGTNRQWKALKKAAEDGRLSEETIDTAVRRILTLIVQSNKMQNYVYNNDPDLERHAKIARQTAAEGMVLLKNEETLPLANGKNVALLGLYSYDFIAGGTGSGDVNEAYTISLEEGLTNAGFSINQTAKDIFEAHKASNPEAFMKPQGLNAMLTPYDPPRISYNAEQLQTIAAEAEVGIITIGRNSGEGGDRVEKDDFLLTADEQEMISSVCDAFHVEGKKVVVVLNIGGVIETASWKSKPDAILLAWQGGQEGGNAAADVLSGTVNPSGKLPMTFPVNITDHASNANFPLDGEPVDVMDFFKKKKEKPESEQVQNKDFTVYEEGIYVGYRHFDKANLETSYPFGYGLSYTSFEFQDLSVDLSNDTILVQIMVTNTGRTTGKEVIQAYASLPTSTIDRPVKELKAFSKTKSLQPGESTMVRFQIPVSVLRYWSEGADQWMLENGSYEIQVGTSSRNIKRVQGIRVTQ
ncbi:MAG: glycoside hydrolase family 3 C-terminal domain-containing protein [Bacteroidota bacterium]